MIFLIFIFWSDKNDNTYYLTLSLYLEISIALLQLTNNYLKCMFNYFYVTLNLSFIWLKYYIIFLLLYKFLIKLWFLGTLHYNNSFTSFISFYINPFLKNLFTRKTHPSTFSNNYLHILYYCLNFINYNF